MLKLIAVVLGLGLALRLLQPIMVWVKLLGLKIRRPGVRVVSRDELPRELGPVFAEVERVLEGLGFRYSHAQWTEMVDDAVPPRPEIVLRHDETASYAVAAPPVFSNGQQTFDVLFVTRFENGTVVMTVDGIEHLTPSLPPDTLWNDHYLGDVEKQWQAHRDSLEPHRAASRPLEYAPEGFAWQAREDLRRTVTDWSLAEMLVGTGDDRWRLRPRAAWTVARRMVTGARRQARWSQGRRVESEDAATPARVAAEIFAFEQSRVAENGRERSARAKRILFLVTMAAFVLAFGWWWSWRLVPALLLVVLLHELGHLAGMAFFGYKDRQLLFLPFIGAAAMGRKEDATALQKVIIYLAGPVPGLVLGFGALHLYGLTGSAWWLELGLMALAINYLNLLPLAVFDGGRVVETLFLSRFPRFQAFFLLASCVAFGVGAWASGDVVLWVLCLLTAASVPARWRSGQATLRIRHRLRARSGRRHQLQAIFETLNEPPFTGLQPAVRQQMATGLLEAVQERRPTLAAAFVGAGIYCGALLAPFGAYGAYAAGAWDPMGLGAPEMATPTWMRDLGRDPVEATAQPPGPFTDSEV